MPKTPELDSACVGATASASAAANAVAASATANAAAATTHTRTHTHTHSGFSAPCSEPAASLQRGADTGFEDMASIGEL